MASPAKATNFERLLKRLVLETHGDIVTVRDLMNVVGRRAYGPIILLLGFISISPLTIIPGGNWLVALITLVFTIQIVVGRKFPWIPKKALDTEFPRKFLVTAAVQGKVWAKIADRITAPRFTFLTSPPFVNLVALACVGASLITFPLGLVPLGPVLPGLTVLLFGVGLAARDGAFLMLAGTSLVGAIIVLIRIWDRVAGIFGLA